MGNNDPPRAPDPHAQGSLRLHLSESPYGASRLATRAGIEEAELRPHLYPDPRGEPFRSAVAEHLDVPTEWVLVCAGTDALLLSAAVGTLMTGREAVVPARTFPGIAAAFRTCRHPLVEVPLLDDRVDPDAIVAGTDRASCWVVCNPHNPTGSILSSDEIAMLAREARRRGVLLVLDEAYAEYGGADLGTGLVELGGRHVVVLRTMSKAYGLAGARVSYAVGHPDALAEVNPLAGVLPPVANRVGVAMATAAIRDQDHVRYVVAANDRARARLTGALNAVGFTTLRSDASFVLTRVPNPPLVVRTLAARGISILDASRSGYAGWVRIGVPPEDLISSVVDAFREAADTEESG
jgi:histidinol-phosphate aminotransferase